MLVDMSENEKKSEVEIINKWRSADHVTLREISVRVENDNIDKCKEIAEYFYEKLRKEE